MSGEQLCLDSNIITYTLGGHKTLAKRVKGATLLISVIAEIESLSYPGMKPQETARVVEYVSRCTVIGIGAKVKSEAIRIRKVYGLKLPDAIIAATAIAVGATLISADRVYFKLKDELLFEHYAP